MSPSILSRFRQSRSADVLSRSLAALIGGYLLAFGTTAFLSAYLPLSRPDRVVTASLLCFAVWVAVAIYAFAVRRPARLWLTLLLGTALLCLAAYLPGEWRLRP